MMGQTQEKFDPTDKLRFHSAKRIFACIFKHLSKLSNENWQTRLPGLLSTTL